MKTQLTSRQQEVVDFISNYISERGFSPSVRDIGAGMGIKSVNAVAQHLKLIEKKGFIRHAKGRARTITVVEKNPQPVCTGF